MLPIKTFSDLPLEVMQNVLDHLQRSRQLATLASFQQTSKYLHKLITPYLYKEVIIDEVRLARLLLKVSSNPPAEPDAATTHKSTEIESYEYIPLRYNLHHTVKITLIQADEIDGNHFAILRDMDRASWDDIMLSPLINLKSVGFTIKRNAGPLVRKMARVISELSFVGNICVRWIDPPQPSSEEEEEDEIRALQDLLLSFTSSNRSAKFTFHHVGDSFPWSCYAPKAIIRMSFHEPFDLNLGSLSTSVKQPLLAGATGKARGRNNILSLVRVIIREEKLKPEAQKAAIVKMMDGIKSSIWRLGASSNMYTKLYGIKASHKWLEEIEWVSGEEAEEEAPCGVCGMPV